MVVVVEEGGVVLAQLGRDGCRGGFGKQGKERGNASRLNLGISLWSPMKTSGQSVTDGIRRVGGRLVEMACHPPLQPPRFPVSPWEL